MAARDAPRLHRTSAVTAPASCDRRPARLSHHPVEVPAIVAAKAAAVPGGQSWAADLPEVLAALEKTWSIRITEPLPGGGTASYVTRARTADGGPLVLKVAAPGTGFDQQARTLTAAAGRGYVRLLAYNAAHEAALLEALGVLSTHVGDTPVTTGRLRRLVPPQVRGVRL